MTIRGQRNQRKREPGAIRKAVKKMLMKTATTTKTLKMTLNEYVRYIKPSIY